MPNPKGSQRRRLPLHVHIAVMFSCLLLLAGVVLGLFNYQQTTRIILASSENLFERIAQDVQLDLQHTYQPIRQLLNLLSIDVPQQSERLKLLAPFTKALEDHPQLASLYVGDTAGSFFMVRPLRTAQLRERFKAPESATYQVWTIQRQEPGSVRAEYLFFDKTLKLLEHREKPNETYDPRSRSWYIDARAGTHGSPGSDADQITTAPYVFFSSRDVGTTLARTSGNQTVIGADLTLAELSATLLKNKVTPSTEIVLYDARGRAVAYPDYARLIVEADTALLAKASDLSAPLAALLKPGAGNGNRLHVDQRRWVVSRSDLAEGGPQGLHLALLVPEDELLVDAYRLRWQGGMITLAILLVCLPLGWLISRVMVKPLRALVREADAIRSFDFNYPTSRRSPVLEIDQLALSMVRVKDTLASFFEITASLSAETRFEQLLQRVLFETVKIAQARSGLIYLLDAPSGQLEPHGLVIDGTSRVPSDYAVANLDINDPQRPGWLLGLTHDINSRVDTRGFEQAPELKGILQAMECPSVHQIAIRLHNRRNETIGILLLVLSDSGDETDMDTLQPDRIAFIQAVSGAAALCIESQHLQARQKQLLDSFIQLLAGAIDAKSPYTGGHCQRVPALMLMLAQAAADSEEPAFKAYQPDDEEWEALHVAAWLHDCGKIVTPEYVVDKATKLETLNDRIHEIRTRVEVLKRDALITYWQSVAQGQDEASARNTRDASLLALDDDFRFIAHCNLGGEAMAQADLQRLQTIAQRTWSRTLDDRLGVSWEENRRQAREPARPLPATEYLLADKAEYLIERPAAELIPDDNPWGFKLDVPAYKLNRGELYNLSIARGTLTAEERYIINHHMVQTIRMLSGLPFPEHLSNVAEIAGGHHEKMDGSGYPKRLRREQLSLPARMMAIADIFEALTAADRPYKKAKTLSEALGIMAGMCRDAHIDAPLFELFIHQRIYQRYGEVHLSDEQIDTVDIAALLDKAGLNPARSN